MPITSTVKNLLPKLNAASRRRAIFRGMLVALFSMIGSLGLTSTYFIAFGVPAGFWDYAISVIAPAAIATPVCVWLFTRIEQINQAYIQLDALASTDYLTQFLNRRAFTHAVIDAAADRSLQAMLVLDVDRFKTVNDSYGHECGDDALRRIADAIRAVMQPGDLAGRLGGEEFGLYLAIATPGEAVMRAEQVRNAVAQIDFRPAAMSHPLSVSIGLSVSTAPTAFDEMFRVADRSLYEAKVSGRNRVAAAYARRAA